MLSEIFSAVCMTAILLTHRVETQVTFDRECPELGVVGDFDLHRYLGLWYEIESYPAVFSSFASCTTANYSLLPDGNVRVVNRSFNTSSKGFDMVDGAARLIEPEKRQAKLGVVFPAVRFSRPVPADGNYWVLDTDYTDYSLVWSCETFNGQSFHNHPDAHWLSWVSASIHSVWNESFFEQQSNATAPLNRAKQPQFDQFVERVQLGPVTTEYQSIFQLASLGF